MASFLHVGTLLGPLSAVPFDAIMGVGRVPVGPCSSNSGDQTGAGPAVGIAPYPDGTSTTLRPAPFVILFFGSSYYVFLWLGRYGSCFLHFSLTCRAAWRVGWTGGASTTVACSGLRLKKNVRPPGVFYDPLLPMFLVWNLFCFAVGFSSASGVSFSYVVTLYPDPSTAAFLCV